MEGFIIQFSLSPVLSWTFEFGANNTLVLYCDNENCYQVSVFDLGPYSGTGLMMEIPISLPLIECTTFRDFRMKYYHIPSKSDNRLPMFEVLFDKIIDLFYGIAARDEVLDPTQSCS